MARKSMPYANDNRIHDGPVLAARARAPANIRGVLRFMSISSIAGVVMVVLGG